MSKNLGRILLAMMFFWSVGMTYQISGFDTVSEQRHRLGVVAVKKEKMTGKLYKFDCSPIVRGCMVTEL
jgi:hypothetical protein